MALVFHRWLAIPLWAIVFCTVALTAPPPATQLLMPPLTLFIIAIVVGIAVTVLTMPALRSKEAGDASGARDKTRLTKKAALRR